MEEKPRKNPNKDLLMGESFGDIVYYLLRQKLDIGEFVIVFLLLYRKLH